MVQKKFSAYLRNLETPSPHLHTIVRIWFDPSPPALCVRTIWMTLLNSIKNVRVKGNSKPWVGSEIISAIKQKVKNYIKLVHMKN